MRSAARHKNPAGATEIWQGVRMNESEQQSEQPIECAQCGEPIWPGAGPYRMITRESDESDGVEVQGAVHAACWPAWAEAHGAAQ